MANGDHDFVAGEILTAANVDDYLMLQAVQKYATAAARDTALSARKREGSVSIQDDANSITVYSGAAWSTIGPVHGALTVWTPTITQSGGVTVTNTYSVYQRVGRRIHGWFNLSVTGAGTGANPIIMSGLPATAATSAVEVGAGNIRDASAVSNYVNHVFLATTTTLDFRSLASSVDDNRLGLVTMVAALASGDTIRGFFEYEAAADA